MSNPTIQQILKELEKMSTDDEHMVIYATDRDRVLGYLPRLLAHIRSIENDNGTLRSLLVAADGNLGAISSVEAYCRQLRSMEKMLHEYLPTKWQPAAATPQTVAAANTLRTPTAKESALTVGHGTRTP